MATVSSDSLRLALYEEATPSETPTTPTWDLIRTTGEGLTYEPIKVDSAEITGGSRGVKDSILAGANVQGAINFELSKYAAFEKLLAAALATDWGDDPGLTPSLTADEAVDQSILRTFLVERRLTKTSGAFAYHRFSNLLVNTLSLSIVPNQPITGSFGFIGKMLATATSEIAGSTYTGAGSNTIFVAPKVTGLALCTYGTTTPVAWMSGSCFSQCDLSFTNNIEGIACIGTQGNKEFALRTFNPQISGRMYWDGDEMLDALIADTAYAFIITLTDGDGNSYQALFPKVKLTANPVNATGKAEDVVNQFSLQSLTDGSPDFSCKLTRVSA